MGAGAGAVTQVTRVDDTTQVTRVDDTWLRFTLHGRLSK